MDIASGPRNAPLQTPEQTAAEREDETADWVVMLVSHSVRPRPPWGSDPRPRATQSWLRVRLDGASLLNRMPLERPECIGGYAGLHGHRYGGQSLKHIDLSTLATPIGTIKDYSALRFPFLIHVSLWEYIRCQFGNALRDLDRIAISRDHDWCLQLH